MKCSVIGCNNPRHQTLAKTYPRCELHMLRYWQEYVPKPKVAKSNICIEDGCNQLRHKHHTRCYPHQTQYRRDKMKRSQLNAISLNRVCIELGCNSPRMVSSGGYVYTRCHKHQTVYNRMLERRAAFRRVLSKNGG